MARLKFVVSLVGAAVLALAMGEGSSAAAAPVASVLNAVAHLASSTAPGNLPQCRTNTMLCTEVYDSEDVFGEGTYVGHDEPSNLFYSNTPGAGNHNRWDVTLPKDPPHAVVPGRSWNFQLRPALWFGMASPPPVSRQGRRRAPDRQ